MTPESLIKKHGAFVNKKHTTGLSKKETRAWKGVKRRMDDYDMREINAADRRFRRNMRKLDKLKRRLWQIKELVKLQPSRRRHHSAAV